MSATSEIWKDIKGYEGLYQVSSIGRVKSLERIANNNQLIRERILKPYIMKRKWPLAMISLANCGEYEKKSINRLVYETFIHEIDKNTYVIPKDKDYLNFEASNLMSCSVKDSRRSMRPQKNSSSVFKGVFYRQGTKKWHTSPCVNGVTRHLGSFDTEIEAAKAYDKYVSDNYCGLYETNDSLGLYGMEGILGNKFIGIDQVKIKHPYRDLFPINQDVLFRIKESMALSGFDESFPIILGEVDGKVVLIDGHTRIRACRMCHIEKVPYVKQVFENKEKALEYAMHVQRDRRNLTDAELASVFNYYDEIKNPLDFIKRDEHGGYVPSDNKIGKSSKETANKLNISEQKVKRLRSLTKPGREKALEYVKKGEKSIHKAYMDDVYSGKKGEIGYKENLFLEKITNCTTEIIPQILKTDEKTYDKWQEELSKIIMKAFKKPIVDK